MPRGGFRPGAGRKPKQSAAAATVSQIAEAAGILEENDPLSAEFADAKEFLQAVVNAKHVDLKTRMSAAALVIPYQCGKVADASVGKKEKRQNNAEYSAANGRFGVPSAPKIAVDNTK